MCIFQESKDHRAEDHYPLILAPHPNVNYSSHNQVQSHQSREQLY